MCHVSKFAIVLLLLIQTLFNCVISTIGQYIYNYYLSIYPNNTLNELIHINLNCSSSSNTNAQLWAQQCSANLTFRMNLVSSGPVIIMTYILGLYTSKLGKRIVLLLPLIGSTSQIIIWLVIIYIQFNEYLWYLSALITGLSGSSGVFNLVMNLIITDNTTEEQRSSTFVYINALQTALAAIGLFAVGYYINFRGFTDLCWISLGLQIMSIGIVGICFKSVDSRDNDDERQPLLPSPTKTKCEEFLQICTVFRCKNRSMKQNLSLHLTLFSNFFYFIALTCYSPFLWLLLNSPFCWSSKQIGDYSAISAISSAVLSLIGMKIFTLFHIHDAFVCVISHVCFCLMCLWIAFAEFNWQLYVGLLLNGFVNYQSSLTLPMLSKSLRDDERNYAFTFVTEMNTIVSVVGGSVFNWIYAQTVAYHRTLTFFIAAGLSSIPFGLNM